MPPLSTRPRAILFDLDGTLTDPAPGITRCLTYALQQIGVAVPPYSTLVSLIGPPWEDSLPGIGVPEDMVHEVIAHYRVEYSGNGGQFEASVYEGIHDMLHAARAAGFQTALATSKPTPSAMEVVRHFGLLDLLDVIGGATLDGSRRHKHDVIAFVLDELGHRDAVMVGDRKYDIEGARHHDLPCVSVTWGHADPGEIAAHRPAAVIDHPAQLMPLLTAL